MGSIHSPEGSVFYFPSGSVRSLLVMGRTATEYERMVGPGLDREYWKHSKEGFEFSMKERDAGKEPDDPAGDKAYCNRRSAAAARVRVKIVAGFIGATSTKSFQKAKAAVNARTCAIAFGRKRFPATASGSHSRTQSAQEE